ncbi:MAG: hypothetical protein FJ128_09525 [Deltaproteobacteria bacterium]|nr:hypothetical protein [Deltaproteobacteria bacterium]
MKTTEKLFGLSWSLLSGALILGLGAKLVLSGALLAPPDLTPWWGPKVVEAAIAKEEEPAAGTNLPRLLSLVEKERQALFSREVALTTREEQLKVLAREVEERLRELKALQQHLRDSLEEETRLQSDHNRHLVATLEAMPPDRAGKVLEKMDDDSAVQLLRRLKGKEAGAILGLLPPDKAARLSHRLLK